MKKLIIGAAVAAMGLGAFATGNEVSSANCVGYMTKSITAGTFYMVGVQFEKIGANSVAGLNDIISMTGIEAVPYDEQEEKAACINVREGNGYIMYYYISDAYDADGKEVTGWAKDGDLVTTADLNLGDGFWFNAPVIGENATLTVAGQVTEATSISIPVPADNQFAIRSNPFPKSVNLSKIVTSGLEAVAYDDQESKGACINVREGNGYIMYYYISDAYDADGKEVTGWAKDGDLAIDTVIDAGASFWINSPNAGTLTFSLFN